VPRTQEREAAEGRSAVGAGASGMVLGAHERGLRESFRRISAAMAAGRKPVAAVDAVGPAEFSVGTPAPVVSRGIALIDVVGPLSKGADLYNWFFGTLTYGQLVEQLEAARRDVRVQGCLLRIDSPGGTVAGVSDLCDAILRFRSEKTILAAVSDLGASCAYQAASCATRIFADRDGWVGSIGVFVVIDDTSQMFQDAGWKVRVFATAKDPYKGAGTPGTALRDEQAAEYQRIVDEMGTEMIRSIYAARPVLKTSGLKLPDGRVYLGADAVTKGLIDGVAPWADILAAMQEGDLKAEKVFTTAR
jgi:signal peptide peptidase SppA